MQRMSGMDASFLYMETPTHHMHVSGTIVLDPSTAGDDFSVASIRHLIETRSQLMPMLRRRLLHVPLSLDNPVWIEDPDFDIDNHVSQTTLPEPGTMHELAEVVGDLSSRPLDRSKPLWEMVLVSGMADGSVALVTKMHHAIIDGISGADLMAHLLDFEPDAPDPPPPDEPWEPDDVPTEIELVVEALADRARDPLRTVRAMARTGRSLVSMGRSMIPLGNDDQLRPAMPFTGPRTMLNAPITGRRIVAFSRVDLEDLKVVKNTFETTVNDVVLAASAITLQRYLAAQDSLPDRPLVAAVPVSVHGQTEHEGINQVSNMFVRLPLDEDDPVKVLSHIHADTVDAKAAHVAMGAELIQDMALMTPPGLYNLALRIYAVPAISGSIPPAQNVVISNVPGPPVPMFIAGARVKGVYPFGPLIEGSGINLTVLSNMGNMDFGVIACPDTVPDVPDIADGWADAVAELRQLADEAA